MCNTGRPRSKRHLNMPCQKCGSGQAVAGFTDSELVTGSGRGLDAAIALLLAQAGANVGVHGIWAEA
jgi:hypothetical protein